MAKTLLVTGSCGLIGSEVCTHFAHELGCRVHGVDNNQRAVFFGPQADTRWNQCRLVRALPAYSHHELDIRDRAGVMALVRQLRPDAIVHAAAQAGHERAAKIPFEDFDTNAVGTMNLLEAARRACPESAFVHFSSSKIYGDAPNRIPLREYATRWDFDDAEHEHGIAETFSNDPSTRSLGGASKVAADVMVQEYGRYFGQPTCTLRTGCVTGPHHRGVELHGFLSYLVRCNLEEREYRIYGYKGKQVRDILHAGDVARFVAAFVEAPRAGEIYNLGGGKPNSCSVLEAFDLVEGATGRKQLFTYIDEPRRGDQICYYSDLRKTRAHYPSWDVTVSLEETVGELVEGWTQWEQEDFRPEPTDSELMVSDR